MKMIFAALALAAAATAQVTGRISGTVLDPTASAIAGARVVLSFESGTAVAAEDSTTKDGVFLLSAVPAASYRLKVEARGFAAYILGPFKVDAAREVSLPPIRMELASTRESITVTGEPPAVQASNAEVSHSITDQQLHKLPNVGRQPVPLTFTQAGVPNLFIHGQRPWLTNITLDGINIQGNYIRASGTNLTTQLFQDQVSEVTVVTSNVNPSLGNGSSQLVLVTPSGSNRFHGGVYWANRNSAFAANAWFNNRDGIRKPPFNLNYFGASAGGPLRRDKLLYFVNYEGVRFPQTAAADHTILTPDARQGVFTYEDLQGQVRKVNVLRAMGVEADAFMERSLAMVPGGDKINNYRSGDSRDGLLKNTAGYRSNRRSLSNQDNLSAKLDYVASPRSRIAGSYVLGRKILNGQSAQLPTADLGYALDPPIGADYNQQLVSLSWRWNPGVRFTNELFGGVYLSPSGYRNSSQFDRFLVANTLYTSPAVPLRTAEEHSASYHYANRSSYVTGAHSVQFGFQLQQMRVRLFDESGTTPVYNLGIGAGNPGLTSAQLPGVRPQDLIAANDLLATLAGYVRDYSQTFNVAARSASFVPGTPFRRRYGTHNLAFHLQDNWRIARGLTLSLGLRHDYFAIPGERDSLMLLPRVENGDVRAALRSNATLDFAGASAGRPLYNRDLNNFAPHGGFAWDVTGDGKTAVRGGFSVHFVSDEHLRNVQSTADQNFGLTTAVFRSGLTGRVSSNLPAIATPTLQVPRMASDNFALNRQGSLAAVDPQLRTPYIETWSFGIQRALVMETVLEVRYVGNHAVKLLGPLDLNQVVIRENGFLADFNRALNNGNLAQAATGRFNPSFDSAIAGSQPLTVFPLLAQGGLLNQATVGSMIQTGQPGQLAGFYQTNGLNGPVSFFANPNALSTLLLTNQGQSTFNALEVDLTRRARGAQFQFNYSYAKTLENWGGPFMDDNNRAIQRSRQLGDQTHRYKANAVYELPFGRGHRLDARWARRALEGWTASGVLTYYSGPPFSILSGRGTLNRSALSGANTASTPLDKRQLDRLFYFRQTGTGPYFADPSVIGRDGRAAGPDTAPFAGQVFFHPAPGTIGGLQRNMFSGPWQFGMNAALIKTTRITDGQTLEIRVDSANVLNHPVWIIGNQRIDATNFGRLVTGGARVIQLGLRFSF